ncbi:hypothetical protein [Bacillus sp. REN3]|uniref:hypothetical protein n=1 Tax=Bacillus sp. REN3 TaxID=2802440 RepID=UPI001AED1BCD|nr:hypothetical protein [Bacillus sp. REN3]
MKFEEIKELLQYTDKESKIYMPNEIFDDLKGAIKNSPHLTFAYSYIYLVHWLYRYAKYLNSKSIITNEHIKEILGYNAKTKGLDYLIKKNGLLDQLEYTMTTNDIPLHWNFDKFEGLTFTTLQETIEEEMKNSHLLTKGEILQTYQIPRKYNIKFPVKAFYRNEKEDEGTFFEISNTHCIPFEVFMYCMNNDDIGTTGFYLYSYIKRMNDFHKDGWDVSIEKMIDSTGLPEKTLLRYLDQLKKYRMIEAIHNQKYFCLAMNLNDRKANTYHAKEFRHFTDQPQEYQKIKVVLVEEYQKEQEEKYIKVWGKKANIDLAELPY